MPGQKHQTVRIESYDLYRACQDRPASAHPLGGNIISTPALAVDAVIDENEPFQKSTLSTDGLKIGTVVAVGDVASAFDHDNSFRTLLQWQ